MWDWKQLRQNVARLFIHGRSTHIHGGLTEWIHRGLTGRYCRRVWDASGIKIIQHARWVWYKVGDTKQGTYMDVPSRSEFFLFMGIRCRKDTQTANTFLWTISREPEANDWIKLKLIWRYIKVMIKMPLILWADIVNTHKWWVDVSYTTGNDTHGQYHVDDQERMRIHHKHVEEK